MAQGFQVTTNTNMGTVTTGTGGAGWNTLGGTNITQTQAGDNSRSNGSGAASIIDSVSGALSALGGAIGSIITSVGTSRALQNGNYYSRYNQGVYNSTNSNLTIIAIVAVGAGILFLARK